MISASRLSVVLPFLLMAGCVTVTAHVEQRIELARSIAQAGHFKERIIDTGLFKIAAYERVSSNSKTATIYIEGDGFAARSPDRLSNNPTPKNPVALRLAAADNSENVIYLARPCQYVTDTKCTEDYWGNKRYAPEIMTAMSTALDNIKQLYQLENFDLVGFSGGGAIAALVAAERNDIASLRTVAGNLDTDAWVKNLHVSPLVGSLNPADIAPKLVNIPQLHFIGTDDTTVPEIVSSSFAKKSGHPNCIAIMRVEGASHTEGWVKKWTHLLQEPLNTCGN